MRALDKELDELDGDRPESWNPEPGEKLVGTVVRYERAETRYGPCPIAIVNIAPDGERELVSVWIGHTVLRNEFAKLRPRAGERIGIKRLPDSEKGYRIYKLVVDRPPGEQIPNFEEAPKVTHNSGSPDGDESEEDVPF